MAETITMPKLGFDMAEGMLVRWVRQVGEDISKGDVLAEIETDKATVEVESSASGVVLQHIVDQGAIVPVNAPIAVVGAKGEKVEAAKAPKAEAKAQTALRATTPAEVLQPEAKAAQTLESSPLTEAGPIKASPLAKKIAKDKRVNLARLTGSGPGGRIVRKDVEEALAGGAAISPAGKMEATTSIPAVIPVSHEDQILPMPRLRQAIARRMTESTTSVPHFYVTHEYKMDALMELRKQVNKYLPDDEKISVNDFIIKAVALTLREFPNLNASFAGDKVIRHGAVNIGAAVAVEGGLLTVVNRDTDLQPLRAISNDLKRKATAARSGKVRPDDIEGSTFSVSNLGMYDVENFAAIINPPEAGILAVGTARQIPVVENEEIKAGWRMKATISVDHRVSDGAEAAQFMQALAKYLEEPLRLLV